MILVFGADGFIGSYLIDDLKRAGKEVVASDVSDFGAKYFKQNDVSYYHIDITAQEQFAQLPTENIDAVVHLACVQPANVSLRRYSPVDFAKVNIIGTLNILEFCRRHRIPKVIYTCSHRNTQGMWAAKAGEPVAETDGRSILFIGDYAMFSISESAAIDCVEHYVQSYDLEGIVLRLPPVYGYGPHTEIFREGKPIKTGFQVFIENAEQGLPLEVWGDASKGRDIVYIKDVTQAIMRALAVSNVRGLFNIASGRMLSMREQAECIAEVFSPPDRRSEIRYQPAVPNLIEPYVYSIEKAHRVLGWQPQYSFSDMLRDYRKERASGRFSFLVERRQAMLLEASSA